MNQKQLPKLFGKKPDSEVIAICKDFLEHCPRSRITKDVLKLLRKKLAKDEFTDWTLAWLKQNRFGRAIYPALLVNPDPKVVAFARKYISEIPPDSVGEIVLYLLKNNLDKEMIETAEKWFIAYNFEDEGKKIIEIILAHKPKIASKNHLLAKGDIENKGGLMLGLLRHCDLDIVMECSLEAIKRHPDNFISAFMLCKIIESRNDQQEAEDLIAYWIEHNNRPFDGSCVGLIIEIFCAYFRKYEDSAYIKSVCKKAAGKNVPIRTWPIRYLNYLDENNETIDWLIGWLEKNPEHKRGENIFLELVNYDEAWEDKRFKGLLVNWLKTTKYDKSDVCYEILNNSEYLDTRIAKLVLKHYKTKEIKDIYPREFRALSKVIPKETLPLQRKAIQYWMKSIQSEDFDYHITPIWLNADYLDVKYDKEIVEYLQTCLEVIKSGSILDRLDLIEEEATIYNCLLKHKPSKSILKSANKWTKLIGKLDSKNTKKIKKKIKALS